MALEDEPFSFRRTAGGRVMIAWNGRPARTLTGQQAARFLATVDAADAPRRQLEMARVTGNFKRGNERRRAGRC